MVVWNSQKSCVILLMNIFINQITSCTDFFKFVFILLDIVPAPRNFLLDLLNFCRTYIFYVKLF
jgi:hypothetical protein